MAAEAESAAPDAAAAAKKGSLASRGEQLQAYGRKTVSFVISVSSAARDSWILDSRSAPFLAGLRCGYTFLLVFRTIFFIFFADVNGGMHPQEEDATFIFLNSFLSGCLIPILAMGICGVIYKRSSLYVLAAALQQASFLCWYVKIVLFPGNLLDTLCFAYDLCLFMMTFWIIREHHVADMVAQLSHPSPTATVRLERSP